MDRFLVRVELPDRPGALGLVASRVGAVRGEIVGIEILERSEGRALDELMVDLPDSSLLELLVAEVTAVDGVVVDDLRRAPPESPDLGLDVLHAAVCLTEATSVEDLLDCLVSSAHRALDADAVEVQVDAEASPALPSPAADGDVARVALPSAGRLLVLRRAGRRFRARERAELAALARIADRRWRELAEGPTDDGWRHASFGADGPLP